MIEKTIGYKVGDHYFPTIEEAQSEALLQIFVEAMPGDDKLLAKSAADIIVANKDAILAVLTDTPTRKYTKRTPKVGKKAKKEITEPPVE